MNYHNSGNFRLGKRTITSEKTRNLSPRPGEVWNAQNLEFEDEIGCKSRPVIVIKSDKSRTFYLRCTSSSGPGRIEIYDPGFCGLRFGTNVRMVLESIDTSRLSHKIGILGDYDRQLVETTLVGKAQGERASDSKAF